MTTFKLETDVHGTEATLRLHGELDVATAPALRDTVVHLISQGRTSLAFDCADLGFIDSTGLGVLVETRTRLSNRRAFLLVAPGVETRRALEISGLDRHFALHDTLDGALSAEV